MRTTLHHRANKRSRSLLCLADAFMQSDLRGASHVFFARFSFLICILEKLPQLFCGFRQFQTFLSLHVIPDGSCNPSTLGSRFFISQNLFLCFALYKCVETRSYYTTDHKQFGACRSGAVISDVCDHIWLTGGSTQAHKP